MKKILILTGAFLTAVAQGIPVDLLHVEFNRTPIETHGFIGNPVEIRRSPDGWHLNFARIGRTESLPLPHSHWKRTRPEAVVFRARALQGRALIKLRMIDGDGHWFTTAGRWIEPDSDRIVFPLDGMKQGNGRCRLMSLQVDPEIPGTELLLKRIDVTFERSESEAIQIVPDTGAGMLPLFDGIPRFIIRNGTAREVRRNAKFTFTGLDGSTYELSRNVELPSYGEIRFTPENPPPHLGVWYGKPQTDTQRVMFANIPENGLSAPANPEFEFAVDNHWIDPAVIEGMRYLGIRAIRSIVGWERIQPTSGADWNFPVFDARLEALEKAGIKMRETLVFTPKWAATDNPKNLPFPRNRKPQMTAWENYVRAMFERYGNRVEYFEIWNEPDLTGFVDFPVEDYIGLCRTARRIAREINPSIKLASGGFATLHPALWNGAHCRFHEKVLQEAGDTFDIHSYHEHGYFPHYQRMVDQEFLPLRKRCGITQPWLASETAMHSAKGTDTEQADCLFKKLLFTWARGAFSYTWYGLCNNGYDLNYSEDNFGIFDRFMNPKYIFAVYAALIRDYREAVFLGQFQAENAPWLFAFRTSGRLLLANWSLNPSGGDIIYAARGNGSSAERIDLEGNSSRLPSHRGIALFPVGPLGSTFVFNGATQLDSVELVAELKLPAAIFRNSAASGELLLVNPWPQAINCAITPQLPTGTQIIGLPVKKELPPGEHIKLPFQVVCENEINQLKITLAFDDMESVPLTAPLHFTILAPDTAFQERKPDFRLNSYAQLESNFEFDPATAVTLWRGPEDLSAEIWIGRNGDRFELRADVRDDRHNPSPVPHQLWQGDSIQFALGFPGQDGHFELGTGLNSAGKPVSACWIVPQGFQIRKLAEALDVKSKRQGNLISYRISLPLSAMRVNAKQLSAGFRFNFLVNDNDNGKERKCFLRLAPGIGSNQTMKHSPTVSCR